jgi:hypothetical protein
VVEGKGCEPSDPPIGVDWKVRLHSAYPRNFDFKKFLTRMALIGELSEVSDAPEADGRAPVQSRPHQHELGMMCAWQRTARQEPNAAGVVLEATAADDTETRVAVTPEALGQFPNVAAHVVAPTRTAPLGK